MRVATWAIQERQSVLSDARARLPKRGDGMGSDARIGDLLDVVHRSFMAMLAGGTVHPGTVDDLRKRLSAAHLVAAAQAIADALRAQAERRGSSPADLQADRAAISDALDALVVVFDPESAFGLDIDVVEARPTLVHALSELAKGPPSALEAAANAPRALLRVRAATTLSALSLGQAKSAVLSSTGLTSQASAADEIVIGASGDVADAVGRLVRASSTIATSLGVLLGEVKLALVAFQAGSDVDGNTRDAADVDALVRAGALLSAADAPAGLLVLDDGAWNVVGNKLAAVPGHERTVDPAAAFGRDRWELSALLVRPPIIGRDDEIAKLSRMLVEPSADGAPLLVAVHGAAGIGKTSLVRAALREGGYDTDDAPVLWGAADVLSPTPYASVAAMFRALAGAPAGHPDAAKRVHRLLDGLASALPPTESAELLSLAPVVVTLLGADDDVARDVEDRSPRALKHALRRALLLVTQGMLARNDDESPAVFVVPGAESVDGPTREALAFVAKHLGGRARVVLLSTTRLRLAPSFESVFKSERIELGGLTAAAARELCGALLDRPGDDDDLGVLVEKARGSPLALVHAVRFAVEGGLLRRRDDRWDASEVEARDIPGRIDRLLRGRVERLPPDARRLLSGIATLGLSLLPAAVEFIGVRLGLSREEVARSLAFLVDTGFLTRSVSRPAAPAFADVVENDHRVAFEHPLLRTAAAAVVDDDEKQLLHGIVADALEAVVPAGLQALAPALARHHRLAGRTAQALARLVVAVRRSARLEDRQGAVALAREGLELCGAFKSTDDALSGDGEWPSREAALHAFPFLLELESLKDGGARVRREALKALMRAAEQSGDVVVRAQALLRVARFDLSAGDAELAESAAVQALGALASSMNQIPASPSSPSSPSNCASLPMTQVRALEAQAWRLCALARFHVRDLDGSARALAEARAVTDASDRRALAVLLQHEGLVCLERGEHAAAVERLLLARAHRVAIADSAGEVACLETIAEAFARSGRLGTALALLDDAFRLKERIGDDSGIAYTLKARADALLAAGDAPGALGVADEARALAKAHDLDRLEVSATLTAARAQLAQDDAAAAEALLDGVRRRARDPASTLEVAILAARARLLRDRESTGAARDRAVKFALSRAQEAAALAEEHKLFAGQVLGMAAAGEALLLDGDANGALTYAQRAAELFEDPAAHAVPVEDVLGVYARVLDASGDAEEAVAVRLRAAQILDDRCARLPKAMHARFWSTPARVALKEGAPRVPRVTEAAVR